MCGRAISISLRPSVPPSLQPRASFSVIADAAAAVAARRTLSFVFAATAAAATAQRASFCDFAAAAAEIGAPLGRGEGLTFPLGLPFTVGREDPTELLS